MEKQFCFFGILGTDLSDSNKEKSKKYAKKSGLPEFEYVLQPRTKGFTFFVNTLRNGKASVGFTWCGFYGGS